MWTFFPIRKKFNCSLFEEIWLNFVVPFSNSLIQMFFSSPLKVWKVFKNQIIDSNVRQFKVGGEDEWALMELSFTHVTTKTLAHSRRFGFSDQFLAQI